MMKRLLMVVQVVFCLISFVGATEKSPDDLWKLLATSDDKAKNAKKVECDNANFESGRKGWTLRDACEIVPGEGRNATAALTCRRSNPDKYSFVSREFRLKPNHSYRIGCWVKANITGKGRYKVGASFYLQFKKGKKTLSYAYQNGLSESGDWTHIERVFSMPPDADSCVVNLALHRGYTGQAWFDDFSLESQDRWFVYSVAPGARTLFLDNPEMKIACYRTGGKVEGDLYCLAKIKSKSVEEKASVKVVAGEAKFIFKKLKKGVAQVDLILLDAGKQQILARETFPVNILTAEQRKKSNACWIDLKGRAIVNGKPFMPIGITTGYCPKADIDIIADSNFNCIAPYASLVLRFNHKKDKQKSIAKTKQVLDYCNSKNLKVIFSLQNIFDGHTAKVHQWYDITGADNIVEKAVMEFKDHPAILAWYVNDERPSSMFDALYARRKLVNKLDPYHPTWCVSMHFTELYFFAQTCDVMGVDPYPLQNNANNMYLVEFASKQAEKLKMPYWVIPQIYNMAFYSKDVDKIDTWTKVHREPSEEEIRSMVLAMALNGAKGFVFYHYNCLRDEDNKIPVKDYFSKNWPKVKNVAAILKTLSPFIMSDYDHKILSLQSAKGNVKAGEFINNDGKQCILITAEGPGLAECVISSNKNLKSYFGHTVKTGTGKYLFKGNNICSDVLIEE